WPKDAWKRVGGANVWGEFSVDEKRGIVYAPTASAKYNFYGADRHGANLFADCLLALDARTGKRLWHFQMVHHDIWDYDDATAPKLLTVRHNGKTIDAVSQVSKQGFVWVFNRAAGDPSNGTLYVVSKDLPAMLKLEPDAHQPPSDNVRYDDMRYISGFGFMIASSGLSPIAPPWSSLTAYDLNEGTIQWKTPLGD